MLDCPCKEPGWCEELQMHLVGRLWEICSGKYETTPPMEEDKRQAYLQAWHGVEITSSPPKPAGLGDKVEAALAKLKITQDRVEYWLGRPCNCKQRIEKLNRLGEAISRFWSGASPEEQVKQDVENMLEQKPTENCG